MTRIGLDAKKMLTCPTGIGNYSRGTLDMLQACADNRYILFSPGKGQEGDTLLTHPRPGVEYVCPRSKWRPLREWWRLRGMVKEIRKHKVELYHGLNNELPFGIRKAGCKSVVTIHDLIFLRFPETYGRLSRLILKIKTRYACRHADRIIAASEQTRRDIMDFYHIPAERISVVYQGCAPIFHHRLQDEVVRAIRKRYGLPERYVLSVGTFERRKNHKGILKAVSLLPEDIHLALVSKPTAYQHELEEYARRLGINPRVRFLNHVPTSDLPALYQGCAAFVYLSFFEGFGIPVLEAMASGAPVVAASGSCLEEVGGKGAWYCPPSDPEAAAGCIRHILEHPEEASERVKAGYRHIERFSEDRIREELLSVYDQALHSRT